MNRVVSNLINKGVDGLIIVPCDNSEKSIASLVNNNISIVLFDRYFPELNVSYVALNNFNASYISTNIFWMQAIMLLVWWLMMSTLSI